MIEVDELVVRYGSVTAVDRLTFGAADGRITVLLGPNGAGKTSTLEVLEGYRQPTSGRVRVDGLDPRRDHGALTRRAGVMLQSGGVHTAVRALEALVHAAALYDDPLEPNELLHLVGLAGRERRSWRQLSGGEQRRLALALALVGRPRVVFLDEPTAGVDPHGRSAIRELVRGLRADGTTVLLTTHDLDEAERLADHVVIVDRGRLLAEGAPSELVRTGSDELRFGAPPGLDVAALGMHLGGATVVEATSGEYVVHARATPTTVAALTAWLAERDLPLADLRAGRHRLEDVFLRLTEPGAGP